MPFNLSEARKMIGTKVRIIYKHPANQQLQVLQNYLNEAEIDDLITPLSILKEVDDSSATVTIQRIGSHSQKVYQVTEVLPF